MLERPRAVFVFAFIAGQNFSNRWNLLLQSLGESVTVVGQDCQRLSETVPTIVVDIFMGDKNLYLSSLDKTFIAFENNLSSRSVKP